MASQGDGLFVSHNWYAARSIDNGQTWDYLDPFTAFPNSPAAFSAGLCCSQRVAQDPQRNLIFWSLQYLKTGSTSSSTNGIRLAVTRGSAELASGTWHYRDITPADFGSAFAEGAWLDYAQIQVSSTYLYITSNVFSTTADLFMAAVIGRIPLAALQNNTSYTMDTFVTANATFIMPVKGATSTMYFGSMFGPNSIKVFSWPESNAAPTTTFVLGLNTTSSETFSCPGPDALNPCGRADTRMQTGWLSSSELGFMWSSSQNASHPYPFTRVAILNPSTLGLIAQPDISSSEHAYLFPSVAPNGRGHLGGIIDRLGGASMPALFGILRDDFSSSLAMNGWETVPLAASDSGTASRWGDYNGAVAHERYPNTWLVAGHTQYGGSADTNSRPHNFWLMRERDVPTATAEIISPTPGTTFMSPNITFGWSAGTGVEEFHLYVGSTPGGYDLYDGSQGTNVSRTVNGLPADGRPIYVTLWAKVDGVFSTRPYNYTALDGRAVMTSPATGSALGSNPTFTWTAGTGVTEYYLYVGSSMGGYDLYEGSQGVNLSKAVSGLPTDGRTIHVRLWSKIGGSFRGRDYSYVANTIASAPAEMNSPAPGSTLPGASATFSWNAGSNVSQYHLYVGSTPAGYDLYDASQGASLSRTLNNLPVDGRMIYVTLWSRINGALSAKQYSYTALDGRAAITSPAPGSTLSSSTATFSWSAGTNVTEYYLYVGSSMGGYDLYEGSQGLNRSKTVTGLPTDGRTIHVRLWSRISGTFAIRDFTFVAATQATAPAELTTPTPGTTFSGSSVTFGWSTGSGVTEYYLYVGSTPGGYDLYEASQGTNLSKTVNGLPTDGRNTYITLFSRIGGMFTSRLYSFRAAGGS